MFVLKIATTVWLVLIALALAIVALNLNGETDTTTRLTCIEVMFGQILAIAFMWQ